MATGNNDAVTSSTDHDDELTLSTIDARLQKERTRLLRIVRFDEDENRRDNARKALREIEAAQASLSRVIALTNTF